MAAAAAAADFLLTHLRGPDGRLLHCWRAGQARQDAFLDDHASLVNALATLAEGSAPIWAQPGTVPVFAGTVAKRWSTKMGLSPSSSPSPLHWLEEAIHLADAMLDRFADPARGGFFYTPRDGEPLLARKKDVRDTPLPSGNGLAVTALLRLARLAERDDYRRAAESALRASAGRGGASAMACGQLLLALDRFIHEDQPLAV